MTTLPNNNSVIIKNADGSINKGGWKESVKAIVETGVSKGEATLAVVETHDDNVLLGADWINKYKPVFNYSTGEVKTKYGKTYLLGTAHLRQKIKVLQVESNVKEDSTSVRRIKKKKKRKNTVQRHALHY